MKLFFEDYIYHLPIIQKSGLSQYFYISEKYDEAKLISVGYFYAPEVQDAVFILPKIFLGRISNQKDAEGNVIEDPGPDNTSRWAVFGKYLPEAIYDLNDSGNPLLEDPRLKSILQMTVWLYQSIKKYEHRNGKTEIISSQPNKVAKRVGHDDHATYIDLILSLIRFHKEHQNLFTYISIINSSGKNKIHWGKTISRVQPVLQNGEPIYGEYRNKSKVINYDEEIIVLFYSVLEYLRQSYRFTSNPNINYSLIPVRKMKTLIETGKGTRYLRTIRKKYFTDELVALWNLLYAFFEKAERISAGKQDEEALMVRNYNIVFEDMIDVLIGDVEYDKYRKLPDGKIIDHLYTDKSLTSDGQIYFIGDSKYYKREEDIDGTSVFKQYTYAKNIIQLNIDAILDNHPPSQIRYRDELSEGYDISPNFFIKGYVNPDKMNFTEPALKPMKNQFAPNRHFINRPFDRDSLVLCGFNINFLYVLSHYVLETGSSPSRNILKSQLRKGIVNRLNETYDFYKVYPEIPVEDFIVSRRDMYRGQLFRPSDTSEYVLLGYDKSSPIYLDELSDSGDVKAIKKTNLA
jgi:hypothetical protein